MGYSGYRVNGSFNPSLADAASSAGKNAAKCAPSDDISKWALSLVNTTKMANDRLATPKTANKTISTPVTE